MVMQILNDELYQRLVAKQVYDVVDFLVSHAYEFSITANVQYITFEPNLPDVIYSKLGTFALFALSGYTFESIELRDDAIIFEAGFGKENFGSVLKVPYKAIFQIVIDESILYLSPVATLERIITNQSSVEKSKNIFKSNPKNQKLFS